MMRYNLDKSSLLRNIKKKVKQHYQRANIVLFGSRARGDARPNSDWDILILIPQVVNEDVKLKIRTLLLDIELETEQVISSIIHNVDTWKDLMVTPLHQNIDREGVLL